MYRVLLGGLALFAVLTAHADDSTAYYKGTCLVYNNGDGTEIARKDFDVTKGQDEEVWSNGGLVFYVGQTQALFPDNSVKYQLDVRIAYNNNTLAQSISDFDPNKGASVVLVGPKKIAGMKVPMMTCEEWP